MNLVEDFVSIGEPFSKHVRKALCSSTGLLIGLNLMTSLLQRKTRLLDLTEFPMVSTDVLVALARSSSSTPIKPYWMEYSQLFC